MNRGIEEGYSRSGGLGDIQKKLHLGIGGACCLYLARLYRSCVQFGALPSARSGEQSYVLQAASIWNLPERTI
jgi:hypothetical protein